MTILQGFLLPLNVTGADVYSAPDTSCSCSVKTQSVEKLGRAAAVLEAGTGCAIVPVSPADAALISARRSG
ncbi:hypothetical protein MACH17_29400 [Phaeobacter inhibens]|nr:hypothetical protein MACH17_29400 [Phaeobacter inhibens]